MKLTTKGQYAIVAMTYMKDKLNNLDNSTTTLREISEKEGISLNYLEQLFRMLRVANLVFSTRGPGGGYRIANCGKDGQGYVAAEINYREILEAVGEKVSFHDNIDGNAGTSNAGIVVSQLAIVKNHLISDFNSMTI